MTHPTGAAFSHLFLHALSLARRGSHKWVHEACLQKWQLQSTGGRAAAASRRSICPVCKQLYEPAYTPKEPTTGVEDDEATGGGWWPTAFKTPLLGAAS